MAKCRFRRNWYRFRMRQDASRMLLDLNCGKFRPILANSGKIWAKSRKIFGVSFSTGHSRSFRSASSTACARKLTKFKFCKFLAGSFSAVSKQNFPRNMRLTPFLKLYKSCILFSPLQIQNVANISFSFGGDFSVFANFDVFNEL